MVCRQVLAVLVLGLGTLTASAQVRIKDITDIEGARSNQLYGVGLVTGLDSTGGRSLFTQKMAVDMLKKMNINSTIFGQTPSEPVFKSASISVVKVHADLPPFARAGSRIDVIVSVIDDARSLQGGILEITPLKGLDGEVYAVASGPLSIGGFAAKGQSASVKVNQLNIGRVPNGAIVEREALGTLHCNGKARLLLKDPDPNTARLIAKVINEHRPDSALAQDAGAVAVLIPPDRMKNPVAFISEITLYEVNPDFKARVVINERTGTVIANDNVTISSVAIAHGNLVITRAETPEVYQPLPFSAGRTEVVPRTQLDVTEQKPRLNILPRATTVAELARSLNALGVSPRDLISIFQELRTAGALNAEIIID